MSGHRKDANINLNPDAPCERHPADNSAQRWSIMVLASNIAGGIRATQLDPVSGMHTGQTSKSVAAEAVEIAREIVACVRGIQS